MALLSEYFFNVHKVIKSKSTECYYVKNKSHTPTSLLKCTPRMGLLFTICFENEYLYYPFTNPPNEEPNYNILQDGFFTDLIWSLCFKKADKLLLNFKFRLHIKDHLKF